MISNKEIDYIQFWDVRNRVFWPGTTALEVYEKSVMFYTFLKTCTLIFSRLVPCTWGGDGGKGRAAREDGLLGSLYGKGRFWKGGLLIGFGSYVCGNDSEKNLQGGSEELGCKDDLDGLEK